MGLPKISVLMPTRNRRELLSRAVKSILNQREQDFELIIVNDASSDQTPVYLDEVARSHSNVRILHNRSQQGFCRARQQASEVAHGEYFAVMDDDAVAHPDRLLKQKQYLDSHVDVGVVGSSFYHLDENETIVRQEPTQEEIESFPTTPQEIFKHIYVIKNAVPNFSVMMRRTALESVDGYGQENYDGYDDKYLWLKMASKEIPIHILKDALVSHMDENENRGGLLDDRKHVFESKHYVLKSIQEWLKAQNIHQFDSLHRKALASVLAKESRYWRGWKGAKLFLRALTLDPKNDQVQKTWSVYRNKIHS